MRFAFRNGSTRGDGDTHSLETGTRQMLRSGAGKDVGILPNWQAAARERAGLREREIHEVTHSHNGQLGCELDLAEGSAHRNR